ncbi:MAG: radical SAM/SPASM domain-containing protein [Dictyoglomus sp. NZ13-RE01]|nr:MAG: radical SAM/SPASM domain-containing protein [Dictyoglomus sp. NZ13-RE01]
MIKEFAFQWHITDLCNLRCKHCYQENFSKERDLSPDILRIILSDIENTLKSLDFDSLSINITGGEPLISPLFYPLLEVMEESKLINTVNIITNGIFLKNHFDKIIKFKKINEIKVSLEGATERTNDYIRGKGNFKIVLENINYIREKFPEFKNLVLMLTLAKYNYKEVKDIYYLAKSLDIKGIILERFIPLGEGKNIKDMTLGNLEWYEVVSQIADLEKVSIRDLLPYKAFYVDFAENTTYGALCNIGDESMALMPNGDVYPCRRLPIIIGNLLHERFIDVYYKLKKFREEITKDKLKGICHLCPIEDCIGCRALAYALTGDLYEEDFQCWKI